MNIQEICCLLVGEDHGCITPMLIQQEVEVLPAASVQLRRAGFTNQN